MNTFVQWIISALSLGAMYALLALGLMLVYSVMNLINFAYGMLLVWTSYVAVALTNAHVFGGLVVVISVLFAMVLSLLMGRIAFRPFLNASPVTLLITSFGVEQVVQYAAVLVYGENPYVVQSPGWLDHVFAVGSILIPSAELVELATGIVVLGLLFLLMNRSAMGIEIRAAAERPDIARLMGIRPNRVLITVFAVSGAIAGIVGLLWFGQLGAVTPQADLSPTLDAFVAIVLGGLGSLGGAVAGGFALGGFESLIQQFVPSALQSYQQTLVFSLVILVLVFRPSGLVGRPPVAR